MSMFGKKKSDAGDARAEELGDAEPTQQIDAPRDRDVVDADKTQPMDTVAAGNSGDADRTRTNPVSKPSAATTGGGSSSAASVLEDPDRTATAKKVPASKTRSSHGEDDDAEPTRVEPIPANPLAGGTGAKTAAATGAGTAAAATTTRRDDERDGARVDPEAERAAERERRRAERDQALGTRRKAVEEPEAAAVVKPKRTTDKFFGSLGLFLLRLVTAAIMGLHGLWKVMNLGDVETMLNQTVIPEPKIMAMVLAGSEIAIAVALLFGMLTRFAGLGVALIGIGALVFVKWVQNPFKGYSLSGELELLLGAVGLLFLLLGGGGWSVDAAFRRGRAASKK
ncbi:hypothetical protein GCM10027418_05040 [Mariniluteicoccus endophyticus]